MGEMGLSCNLKATLKHLAELRREVHASAEGEPLHPHLSVLNIVLHCIQNLLCIGNPHNLEFHIPEADRVEGIVLPDDDESAFVDWGVDFETYTFVREEGELGGVPYLQHFRVIEEQCAYF